MKLLISCNALANLFKLSLLIFFCWNSVFAGAMGVILCLHESGTLHVELVGKEANGASLDCNKSGLQIEDKECLPCADFRIGATDPGPFRPNELIRVDLPTLSVSELLSRLIDFENPQKPISESWNCTRAPPEAEPISQQISRVIVLRL